MDLNLLATAREHSHVYRFGYGQQFEDGYTQPGDFILTHRHSIYSNMISLAQRRVHKRYSPYAHWSHVACVAGTSGQLIEAKGHGVVWSHIDDYKDVEYHYVDVMAAEADRHQMYDFLHTCVGRPYAWGEIASLAFSLATGIKVGLLTGSTLICSALAAEMLCRMGTIWPKSPSLVLPADIAWKYKVTPDRGANKWS